MRTLTPLCAAATLLAALLATGAPAAVAADPAPTSPDRITTTIADWSTYSHYASVLLGTASTGDIHLFTVPAVGTSGPISFTTDTGEVRCVSVDQRNPFESVTWYREPCQNVTTVPEPGTDRVGFMATDGPYQGRFLGDHSRGGVVDWAQETFYAVEVPEVTARVDLTPPSDPELTRRPEFAGTGTAQGHVVVTRDSDGATVGEADVAADGTWTAPATIDFDWSESAALTATLTLADGSQIAVDRESFRVADPVTITAGEPDADLRTVQVTGTADPASVVTLTDGSGAALATATVGADGTWGPVQVNDLAFGDTTLIATETVDGATVPEVGTATTLVRLVDPAAPVTPVTPPTPATPVVPATPTTPSTPVVQAPATPTAQLTPAASALATTGSSTTPVLLTAGLAAVLGVGLLVARRMVARRR
ncbi:hypothetical protein [Cellulomonas denverensis]|uniref:Gram-positive cocci surface proteins LPxTG domain-containing protein n=1 Tax=Cellulomonas denverensis TaxID=264297 RepID=A0A7X6KYE9_9CELL|nr:hypothetical protein [Cellulomonas denverensis]NKY24496.1 hypothetical protein [Cellulomonas denverensis]GIG27334.1 hypothetical protein Cde04nite_35780 [Cellulomonas denverensis]